MLQNYINGQWQPQTGKKSLDIINPSTQDVICKLTLSSTHDVDQAVNAAKLALPQWQATLPNERAIWLRKVSAKLSEKKNYLIQISHQNNGKPYYEAAVDVDDSIACFEYYANLIENFAFDFTKSTLEGFETYFEKHAMGVVGLITPWNFPYITSTWKIAPALAAGCTLVFKPSEIIAFAESELAQIIDEVGLPKGVFNLILGDAEVAKHMVQHSEIQKVSFTGSTPVGTQIMQSAAISMKRINLELGGKSPILVFADANLDDAVEKIINGVFFNAGQMCSATTRLLVHDSIADELLGKLKIATQAITFGNSEKLTTVMGPITLAKQRKKINDFLDIAAIEGLKSLVNASNFQLPDKGYFVAPHIFVDVPSYSRLWTEEIFGPILCCQTFHDDQEAIQKANNSVYGLAATILSGSMAHGRGIAKRLKAGHIWINANQIIPAGSSWGGFKMSGLGRELGESGLENFLETSVTTYNL
ncbi:aldehyde dehydrogenase family protein [Acinetobacter seifertii]|uniref:aldehyde dehydrogenase family protein n=1 Tax=Acinetobacter seifertii TaxID=1530123 RepID=UPI0032B383AC